MWTQSIRRLARSPGWVFVVVLTLALGIGATTAIFSVIDAAVFRPPPFPDSDRLVVLDDTRDPNRPSAFSYPNFADARSQSRTLQHMAGYVQGYFTKPSAQPQILSRSRSGSGSG